MTGTVLKFVRDPPTDADIERACAALLLAIAGHKTNFAQLVHVGGAAFLSAVFERAVERHSASLPRSSVDEIRWAVEANMWRLLDERVPS